jgi:hypothetical protein
MLNEKSEDLRRLIVLNLGFRNFGSINKIAWVLRNYSPFHRMAEYRGQKHVMMAYYLIGISPCFAIFSNTIFPKFSEIVLNMYRLNVLDEFLSKGSSSEPILNPTHIYFI